MSSYCKIKSKLAVNNDDLKLNKLCKWNLYFIFRSKMNECLNDSQVTKESVSQYHMGSYKELNCMTLNSYSFFFVCFI